MRVLIVLTPRRLLASLALLAFMAGSTLAASTTQSASPGAAAADAGASEATSEAADPAILESPERIAEGKDLWEQQCRHCHGRSAYPGKAPKLKPRKYTPEFVFDRVTNGFRKMPPWKDVYSSDQRWAIVAYVMSRDFSP